MPCQMDSFEQLQVGDGSQASGLLSLVAALAAEVCVRGVDAPALAANGCLSKAELTESQHETMLWPGYWQIERCQCWSSQEKLPALPGHKLLAQYGNSEADR